MATLESTLFFQRSSEEEVRKVARQDEVPIQGEEARQNNEEETMKKW